MGGARLRVTVVTTRVTVTVTMVGHSDGDGAFEDDLSAELYEALLRHRCGEGEKGGGEGEGEGEGEDKCRVRLRCFLP